MNTQPKKPNLLELDAQELTLLAAIEAIFAEPMDEVLDPGLESERLVDAHLEQLAAVQGQLADKLEGYCKTITAKQARAALLMAEAKLYQEEAHRLAEKAHAEDDTADFLQLRLKAFLERRGLTEFETRTHKLKIVRVGGKLALQFAPGITPEEVGEEFTKTIPARVEFDRERVEAALKEGKRLVIEGDGESPVEWARFAERPTRLKIS